MHARTQSYTLLLTQYSPLVSLGRCEPSSFAGFQWPETSQNTYASVPCPCKDVIGSLAGQVYRFCKRIYDQGATWSNSLNYSQCVIKRSNVTMELCNLSNVSELLWSMAKLSVVHASFVPRSHQQRERVWWIWAKSAVHYVIIIITLPMF